MTHIMVDLETWGVRPGAMFRSLGAVVFDPPTGRLGREFYANIDEPSQEAIGLKREGETVLWWADQDPELQDIMEVDQKPLAEVLKAFTAYWTANQGVHIWSHGANFDEVLLSVAYRAAGLPVPWKFWDVRCCRTVLALGNRRAYAGADAPKHHALVDAKAQAVAVMAAITGRLPVAGWK